MKIIRVTDNTHKKLSDFGETYNDVIERLLKENEKYKL